MPGAESHYVNRAGWLRAAVLGANDGIISTASLARARKSDNLFRFPAISAKLTKFVSAALL